MTLPWADCLTVRKARKKWKSHPETCAVAVAMIEAGWLLVLRKSGHVDAWCPHERPAEGFKPLKLHGTPQNDGSHASRVRRKFGYCPGRHGQLESGR